MNETQLIGLIGLLIIIVVTALTILIYLGKIKIGKNEEVTQIDTLNIQKETNKQNQNYKEAYKPECLLTINEKREYWKIKNWAESKNLIVFAKVRLADIISPRTNYNQTLFWKIQAKHVDFVVCDQNIDIKCIIELQDSSHYKPERIERDKFVREVLVSCGYKLIQTFKIQSDVLDRICGYSKEENPPCSV